MARLLVSRSTNNADGNHLTDEARNGLRIIRLVGVVDNAAPFVGADLILVDDPVQRRAVAQLVVVDFQWDAGQGEEIVVDEAAFVLAHLTLGMA